MLIATSDVEACDICAVYIATEVAEGRTGFRLGVAEQFSRFRTVQQGGVEVRNTAGEWMDSSITQFLVGYQFTERIGVQLNVPFIARTFRRLTEDGLKRGQEIGAGDLSLLGTVRAFSRVTDESVFRLLLLGGLKLPSGNSDPLVEEFQEGGQTSQPARALLGIRPLHSSGGGGGGNGGGDHEATAIRGHDFARGSGSVDGLIGAQLYWSWRRAFLTAGLQYAIRTEGDFEYQFADDITWLGGPGIHLLLSHDYTLGVSALLSGETKGNDEQQGRKLNDTAITALYVGPGVSFTWGTGLSADVAVDIPAIQNNTGLQMVPDFRLRGGFVWRF